MEDLGKILRELRESKGWSQENMAHELNISLLAYSKIERNITDVNLSRLNQIATLFGLTVEELLSHRSTKHPSKEILQELKKSNEDILGKEDEIIGLLKKILKVLEEKR